MSIQFSNNTLNGTKSLNSELKTKTQNTSTEFRAFLERVRAERIFLRHAQITKFIGETKSKKKEEIAAIIGYQDIVGFRDVIQSATNALRKDPGYTTAKQYAEDAKNKIFQLTKNIISTEEELFKKATGLTAQFNLGIAISDDASYDEVLALMLAKISKPDSAKTGLRLEQLKKECNEFIDGVAALLVTKDVFTKKYNKLAKDKSAVSQLNIEQFLVQGHEIIEAGHFEDEKCPFCLTHYNLEKLQGEVGKRIVKIEHIRKQYEESEEIKSKIIAAIGVVGTVGKRFTTEYDGLDKFSKLVETAFPVLEMLRNWIKITNTSFAKFEEVIIPQNEIEAINQFSLLVKQNIEIAAKEINALQLSEKEKKTYRDN